MMKVLMMMALAAFAFGGVPRSNAGTDVIDGYGTPAPSYGYAPPPRPVYYVQPPPVNVLIFPAYGYYGPRFGVHRFYGRHVFVRPHHPYWR